MRVRFDGAAHTVVGLSGTLVRLASHDGQPNVIQLAHLLTSPGFEVIDRAGRPPQPLSAAAISGVPQDAVDDALRWEPHIIEVLTGISPDAPEGTHPRSCYDPATHALAERERAKAAELAAAGENVTARTVKRKRQRYQDRGLAGLVDWRADRARPASGRADERVVRALQQAISGQESGSTQSASFTCGRPGKSWPTSTAPTRPRCWAGPRSTGCSSASPWAATRQARREPGSRWPTAPTARSAS